MRNAALIVTMTMTLTACTQGSGGNAVCDILQASQDSTSLTIGLGKTLLAAIQKLTGTTDATSAASDGFNTKVKDVINEGLTAANLNDLLTIEDVSAVPSSSTDDGVRFFQLGGKFAAGLSLASNILRNELFSSSISSVFSLNDKVSPFDFIEDSFNVNATAASTFSFATADFNANQWAYKQTDLDAALSTLNSLENKFQTAQPDRPVVVAVIDTGVDYEHPALSGVLYKKNNEVIGYDYINNDNNADDDQGHGTHCAGIIAAEPQASETMVGVAQLALPGQVKIMPIKVLGADGSGSTTAINKGVRFAIKNGADVISMSLGGAVDFDKLMQGEGAESKIIREAIAAGIIVVVAAGNENCPLGGACTQTQFLIVESQIDAYTVLPCSYNGTICVGASDPDTTVASYSNYPSAKEKGVDPSITDKTHKRQSPDILAPGTNIYAPLPDGDYAFLSGTSMATPFVAGLAAIYVMKTDPNEKDRQQAFWQLLQKSEVSLTEEDSETRSFVGQVDLNYFAKQLQAQLNGTGGVEKPTLKPVEDPKGDEAGSPGVTDLLSLVCGA